jgi:hypothetical protein
VTPRTNIAREREGEHDRATQRAPRDNIRYCARTFALELPLPFAETAS